MGGMTGFAEELEQGLTGTDTPRRARPTRRRVRRRQTPFADALKDFKGVAVAVRFDDGALEIEGAGDTGFDLSALYGSDRGADVVETLPADTAAAIGVGFEEGWLTQLVEQVASFTGGEMTAAELLRGGLRSRPASTCPQDVETLLGRSAALSFGSDFDPEAFFNSGDGSELPIALKVQGDADGARAVVDKIVAQDAGGGETSWASTATATSS